MLSFHMTENEVNELVERYRRNDGLIQYSDFCAGIDEQFLNNEAKAKTFEIPQVYTKDEQEIMDRLFRAIKNKIATKRILIKQPF